MLYEVITVEKKEVQKYAHEKRLSLEEAGREIRYEAFRITSYNVCYTKLLRNSKGRELWQVNLQK